MFPVSLDAFENYQNPSDSRELKNEISTNIEDLSFLGQGAYLHKGKYSVDTGPRITYRRPMLIPYMFHKTWLIVNIRYIPCNFGVSTPSP